ASSPLRINHYGYLNQIIEKKSKKERNLELLRQQVAEDPRNSFVHFNLGAEYVRLGSLDQALAEYQLAFKYLPDLTVEYAPFLLRNIANLLLAQGRFKEALNILQEAKAAYPGYTDLLYLEGQAYLALYRYTEAAQAFQRCLALGENSRYTSQRGVGSYLAWMGLGSAYEGLGELGKAAQAYRSALRANERHLPALQKLGELILPREERGEAVAYLKGLVDWQSRPEAALVLAGLFADQGYAEEAQELLRAACFDSADGRAALARARILTVLRQYREALAVLAAIPETSEAYAPGLCEAAFLQALLGQGEAAAAALRRAEALGVQAGFLEGYRRVAAALAGFPPEEVGSGETIMLGQTRQNVLGLLERLLALQEFEAFERALSALRSLGLPPEEEAVELGKLYHRRGFWELAAAELLRAARAGKGDAETFAILGEVALKKEMPEEAEAFYRQAIELEPRRLAFYTALAGALAAQNRYADAAEALRGALWYYPDSDLLRETLRLTEAMAREKKERGDAGVSGS
ncbi:MAG: tetratricopeptide repeat protein, partial [Bacillota bacterium]|nr:tetratricopeptide repeat protein [Bacillota bacterium]